MNEATVTRPRLPRYAFTVFTAAEPHGSKSAVMAGGRPILIEAKSKASRERRTNYRADVKEAAREALEGRPPWAGPISLSVFFMMRRPRSHWGSGRNVGRLKPNAPEFHTFKPDVDKLLRSTLDALTGLCFVDDSQVCKLIAVKAYANHELPRVEITVRELEDGEGRE
jgi:crossover junction endodeoxyribonuclease RusA